MTIAFRVYAALHEDISAPYIWLSERPDTPRPVVKLVNRQNGKAVVCQVLKIDKNFRDKYKGAANRLTLAEDSPVAVINEWYRDVLVCRRETRRNSRLSRFADAYSGSHNSAQRFPIPITTQDLLPTLPSCPCY
jgi:hypothetical protein